jgi:crotonobetainyl-CoA:carnitine CoA-transferase CaiB-like acyl-CoA transferase
MPGHEGDKQHVRASDETLLASRNGSPHDRPVSPEQEHEDDIESDHAALVALTVLDLSEGVAGAFATKLLADYGARVIKVERPGRGDPTRHHGPFSDEAPHPEKSALFLYLNTNKLSVTLDYTSPTGASILRRLLDDCDGIVEDHPTKRRGDYGLGFDEIVKALPRMVITQVSAYGSSGPYAGRQWTNLTAYAAGGQMAMCGDPDREPLLAGGYQAEYQLGLHAYAAILGALWHAAQTEHGQVVDVSAIEAMATTLELSLSNYLYRHRPGADPAAAESLFLAGPARRGNTQSAAIGLYPCADGYIGVHAMARQVPALLALIDCDDESLGTDRLRRSDELSALIYAWAADVGKKEAYRLAGEHRAPLAFVHDMKDLLESKHLRVRRAIREVDHPEAGVLSYPRGPFEMTGAPWREGRAPLLAEHNVEVLCEMAGLDRADLSILRAAGVI